MRGQGRDLNLGVLAVQLEVHLGSASSIEVHLGLPSSREVLREVLRHSQRDRSPSRSPCVPLSSIEVLCEVLGLPTGLGEKDPEVPQETRPGGLFEPWWSKEASGCDQV